MDFFDDFLVPPPTDFSLSTMKQVGFEIDEFSRVYGRMLLTGHVIYKAGKNYRSKQQFEEFKVNNTINIPSTIVLFEESNDVLSNFKNINNMFINKYDTIMAKYNTIKMFGYVKAPRPRKNGKLGRSYKIQRKERFIIPVVNLLYKDDNNLNYCSPLSIHCTFRKKLT